MKQYYIICDISLCLDCNNCFMACKDEHVGNKWLPYTHAQPRHGHRWMNILRKERGQFPRIDVAYLPMPCQHCADPPCTKVNPGCLNRREDGIVLIDTDKAIGDRSLVDNCPFGTIYWNEEAGVAQKCTMCAHILEGGLWERKIPRCVHSCPTHALEFYHVEPEEMEKKIEGEALERYRPELGGCGANVYYRNLYRFEKLFIAGGLLKGGECAEGVEVTLTGGLSAGQTPGFSATRTTDYFGDFKFDGLDPGEYTISVAGIAVKELKIDESINAGSITI